MKTTPTKVLECIRDKDGLHSNAASYEAAFVQQLATELLDARANRAELAARVIALEEAGEKLSDDMLLVGRALTQADADVKMWRNNHSAAEDHVTELMGQLSQVSHATTLWDAHAIAHNALKSESPAGRAAGAGVGSDAPTTEKGYTDPKLSDCGARRGPCAEGGKAVAE